MTTKPGTSSVSDKTPETFIKAGSPYMLCQAIKSGTCNLRTVCRGCLAVNNEKLYTLLQDEKHYIINMFFKITSIQVNEGDGLPNSICEECYQEILRCYNFKTKCLDSDHLLKTLLKEARKTYYLDEYNDASHGCDSKEGNLEFKQEEIGLKVNQNEETEKNKNYLESFCDAMSSDDEALCIVQDNKKNADLVIVDNGKHVSIRNKKQYKDNKTKLPKERKQHTCPHCPKKYNRRKALRDHMQKVHNETKPAHSCEQCADTFTCDEDLKLHQSLHNKDSVWKCNQCNKEFKVRTALRRHLQRHMSAKRHSCDICGKQFVEHYAMLRHKVVHSGLRPEKKYNCQLCDKSFADKRALESHAMRTHTAGAALPCACACGKRFASRRLLVSHRRVHTDHKPYACQYCDKRFRHESARKTHHRTHTGERPYVCSACGKTFIQHSNLTMHMRSHTGERPYSCSKCNSKFSTGTALKNHERTHTGERPYSCSVCGKRFARRSMKAHMRLHTGERPFSCAMCPRRFNNASHLREHSRMHTGERPFECATCTQKFATKSHLIKHVRFHEKKTPKGVVMYRSYKTADKGPKKIVIVEETPIKEEVIVEETPIKEEVIGIQEAPMVVQELTSPNEQDTDRAEVIVVNNAPNLPCGYIVDDMNLLAVNEGEVSISSTSALVEGTLVKLYQLDQSLVQIHRTPGKVTISQITSKMTANF